MHGAPQKMFTPAATVGVVPSFSSCESLDESVLAESHAELSASLSSISSWGLGTPKRRSSKRKLKLTPLVLAPANASGAFEAKSKRAICEEYLRQEESASSQTDEPITPTLAVKAEGVLKSSFLRQGTSARKQLSFAPCVQDNEQKHSNNALGETWCKAPLMIPEEDEDEDED